MPELEIIPELRGKDVTELGDATPDELRGKRPEEMEQFLQVLDAHLRSIHQDEDTGELRDKTPAEATAFTYGIKLRDKVVARIEEHRAIQEVFAKRPKAVQTALANIRIGGDDAYADVRRMTNAEARDRALRTLDDRNSAAHLRSDEKDEVEKQIRRNPDISRRILVTENEHYREAWMKLVTQPNAASFLSDDERQAVRAYNEYRAASEGTTTAGGFGIPVKLAA